MVENPKQKKTVKSRNVNYDAGADILHHFQLEWNELHELAELNAFKAQKVDTLITKIYGKLEYEWNNITYLNNTLALIPQINNGIQNLMDQIGIFHLNNVHRQYIIHKQYNKMSYKLKKQCYRRNTRRNVRGSRRCFV